MPVMYKLAPSRGVPFTASSAACLIGSICEMPSGVAGSPLWVTIMRAAVPPGETNSLRPRWKSALENTSGGK